MLSTLGKIQAIDTEHLSKLTDVLAELDTEQKIWLSGYLAGQSSSIKVSDTDAPVQPAIVSKPENKITILYGSQTGNARNLADNFFQLTQTKGLEAELISLAEYKPRQITKEHNIVLIISTHGEGDAPDDAEIFYEYLFSAKAPKLEQLQFSILALGDSSYEKFCQTGIDLDQRFEQLNAHRIHERVDCDLDYAADAQEWQQTTLDRLVERINPNDVDSSNVVSIATSTPKTNSYDRNNPFAAEIIASQRLTTEDSVKVVYHIELSLEHSGITYSPGDALGVISPNPAQDVSSLIEYLKLEPETPVNIDNQQASLEELLTEVFEISLLNKNFLTFYAEKTADNQLIEKINTHQKFTAFVQNHQLIDVVKNFPAVITAQELIDKLPKITARMYSIASSHLANPDEVHLTVALVSAEKNRTGLISGAFCDRLEEGDQVSIFVEPNHNFSLPEDPNTPIIMVGPGTGIAPFRGFLQDRQALAHPGKNWLFFGNPNKDHDFLYQLEWQQFIKTGVLTNIDLAFSRDQANKIYVQDHINAHADEIWHWLEEGAHLYLCGDKNHMAKSVESTLLTIIQQKSQQSTEYAMRYLKQLKRDKRYQKDVY